MLNRQTAMDRAVMCQWGFSVPSELVERFADALLAVQAETLEKAADLADMEAVCRDGLADRATNDTDIAHHTGGWFASRTIAAAIRHLSATQESGEQGK